MGARYDLTAKASKTAARPLWPVLLGCAAVIAAPAIYFPLIDNPLVRSTAWPTFLLAGAGAVAGACYARRDERTWVRLLGGSGVALLLLFAGAFFWLAALPAPQAVAGTLEVAKDFTLKDNRGRDVTLSSVYKSGPVLLVFYRGFW